MVYQRKLNDARKLAVALAGREFQADRFSEARQILNVCKYKRFRDGREAGLSTTLMVPEKARFFAELEFYSYYVPPNLPVVPVCHRSFLRRHAIILVQVEDATRAEFELLNLKIRICLKIQKQKWQDMPKLEEPVIEHLKSNVNGFPVPLLRVQGH